MANQTGNQQPNRPTCEGVTANGAPCRASRTSGSAFCSKHQHLGAGRPKRCRAIAASGKPCQSAPLAGKAYCLMHDPESAELRRAAAHKGGENSSNAKRLAKVLPSSALTTQELRVALSRAFVLVLTGAIDPGVARAASATARTISELELNGTALERLEELERLAGERAETGPRPADTPAKWWEQEDPDEQG